MHQYTAIYSFTGNRYTEREYIYKAHNMAHRYSMRVPSCICTAADYLSVLHEFPDYILLHSHSHIGQHWMQKGGI